MNREIKFRLYSKKTKCLYEDSGLTSLGINDAIKKAKKQGYIIMQYTGLKDKNGVEIYDSDILKVQWEKDSIGGYMQSSDSYVEKEEIVTVEWMNIGWGFKKKDGKFTSLPKNCRIEVIGDIYSTPALLNK